MHSPFFGISVLIMFCSRL